MIRITRNDDIAFNVNEVRGKGDRYKITFYTVNSAVNIQKTDQDVTDGIITLNGSELMTIGEGVMNFRVDNIAPNAGYNDGVFNSSFTRTTKYYIVSGVIIPDGEDTETVIDLVSELQNSISSEITRSTNKDNAHDAALANVYTKAEIDDMLDDIDVVLPDNIVIDANYTHTDNNYTTTEKTKLASIASGAEVNVQSDWNVTSTSSDAFIKNKPTNVSAFTNDAGYLTSYTETDPTVPNWAKQSTKPTYTASEVGALPSSTVIPSKTSDLTNDSNFVSDAHYVHTDNNLTNSHNRLLNNLGNNITITSDTLSLNNVVLLSGRQINLSEGINVPEFVLDRYYDDEQHPENNQIALNTDFDSDNGNSVLEMYDYYSGNSLRLPIVNAGFLTNDGLSVIENNNYTLRVNTQTTTVKACEYGVIKIKSSIVSNLTITLDSKKTLYQFIFDKSLMTVNSVNFPSGTVWQNGDAFDWATFKNGSSNYAFFNLLKISDSVILADYKVYE